MLNLAIFVALCANGDHSKMGKEHFSSFLTQKVLKISICSFGCWVFGSQISLLASSFLYKVTMIWFSTTENQTVV